MSTNISTTSIGNESGADIGYKPLSIAMQHIDYVMALHPSVAVARSFYRPDSNNQLFICIAIRFQQGKRETTRALRRHACGLLPESSVPVKYFHVANLEESTDRGLLGVADLKKVTLFDSRKSIWGCFINTGKKSCRFASGRALEQGELDNHGTSFRRFKHIRLTMWFGELMWLTWESCESSTHRSGHQYPVPVNRFFGVSNLDRKSVV